MGVSQRQTVLMCLRSSHPWRDPPVRCNVQAPENLTEHVRLSYFIICIPAFCRSLHILDSG